MKEDAIVGTDTDICHIRVEDGQNAAIIASGNQPSDGLPQLNAAGLLMLPAFKEMHIHIDKTYYSGPWKAVRPVSSIRISPCPDPLQHRPGRRHEKLGGNDAGV
ncbi:hypothetical protein M3194_12475 [Paenibacillus glycanilyticus]|nr:hypothetical protein [Paenibacillus glycanilyticus]MCM3628180.1 hypothetical protein [Paenibacillus glycanilyticus]